MTIDLKNKLVAVRPDTSFETKRNLNYFQGISENSAGTKGISMNLVRVPPGARPSRITTTDLKPRSTFWKAEWKTVMAKD